MRTICFFRLTSINHFEQVNLNDFLAVFLSQIVTNYIEGVNSFMDEPKAVEFS